MSIRDEILRLKKEKNAVVLGHYYLDNDLQKVSDFTGDSLALAQKALNTDCGIIVFCGVHFMAETAKILNPDKKVLVPDISATCSLAECCKGKDFARFKAMHPGHTVISYINCSAEIKALSDIICTSGNAEKIVRSLPEDEKIIFAPDRNLGAYINKVTGRNMLLWDGACEVHDILKPEIFTSLKQKYPSAEMIAHPECNPEILAMADFIGSTKAMLGYVKKSDVKDFIVGTEWGILYQLQLENPDKNFITPMKENAHCIECKNMKLNTMEKLRDCLVNETPEIIMSEETIEKAKQPIVRMLDISRKLGLI